MEQSLRQSRISATLIEKLPEQDQQAIAAFLQDLEAAMDRDAVLAHYGQAHPRLNGVFRFLAQADKSIQRALGDSATKDFVPPATNMDLADRLKDFESKFEIQGLIKAGGMGLVYKAKDRSLERDVAIKICSGRGGGFQQFIAEQQALAKLQQHNIVPIHWQDDLGDIQYFVMKYIDGVALDDVVKAVRQSPSPPRFESLGQAAAAAVRAKPTPSGLSTPTASTLDERHDDQPVELVFDHRDIYLPSSYYKSLAGCISQIATAVQFAHAAGVLHRDLKSSNVMIDKDEHVWIIDFGLARNIPIEAEPDIGQQPDLREYDIAGTPRYMAPEQLEGRPSVVSDVWGIGTILYELLTFRPPFADRERHQIEPPERFAPTTPRDLSAICQKCLAIDPHQRYQSAGELAEDLRRWTNHEPIAARNISVPERAGKWIRRNPLWTALSAVALAALVALLSYQVQLSTALEDATAARNDEALQRNAAEQREREVARYRSALLQQTALRLLRIGKADQAKKLIETPTMRTGGDADHNWESRLLHNELHRATAVYKWKQSSASRIAVEPESGRVLVGDSQGAVRILNLTGGNVVAQFPAHRQRIAGVGFIRDGNHLVTAGDDGFVKVWQADGKLLQSIECHIESLVSFAISPDGTLAATAANDGVIAISDLSAGKRLRVLELDGDAPLHVCFNPNGQQLVAGTNGGHIIVWSIVSQPDAATIDLRLDTTLTPTFDRPRNAEIQALAFDSSGNLLAAAYADDKIRLWDMEQRQQLDEFPSSISGNVNSLQFDPFAAMQLSAEVSTSTPTQRANEAEDTSTSLANANWPRNDLLIAGTDAAITMMNSLRNPQERILGHSAAIVAMAATADGTIVSASSDGELRIWKRDQRRTTIDVQAHRLNVVDLAFSPDSRRLVSASYDHEAAIIDAHSGDLIHTLGKHTAKFNPSRNGRPGTIRFIDTYQGHGNVLTCCSYSPRGTLVATGGMDNTVRFWKTDSGEEAGILSHPSAITSVCFEPVTGQRLSTVRWDDNIRIWEVETRSLVLKFKVSDTEHVNQVVYSPDGKTLATAHGDGLIGLWDASSGHRQRSLPGHAGSVECVAFDRSGRRFASGGDDRTIRLWEKSGGEWRVIREFVGHTGSINRVEFSPDGSRLVSASNSSGDETARIWDIEIGLETLILEGDTSVVFSPDGKRLAMTGPGRAIRRSSNRTNRAARGGASRDSGSQNPG
jgi:WD40 repeat protein/serine/threonine protein kinase